MADVHWQSYSKYVYLCLTALACLPLHPFLTARNYDASFDPRAFYILAVGILLQGALAILTVELTWGTTPFPRRFAEYWLWIGAALAAWLVQAASSLSGHELQQLLLLPIVALGTQLPFWILRFFVQTRLVRIDQQPAREKWSLRDFAGGIALIGISFAAWRAAQLGAVRDELVLFIAALLLYPHVIIMPAAGYLLRKYSAIAIAAFMFLHGVCLLVLMLILGAVTGLGMPFATFMTGLLLPGAWIGLFVLRGSDSRLVVWKEGSN